MKIAVCCKAIPGAVTDVGISVDGTALEFQSQLQAMNECDEYALEEAAVLKQEYGGEITALTMGPITTQDILYLALAKGADNAVRIDVRVQDPYAASTVLAAALGKMEFDLVLTGTQSRDSLSSFVGVATAARMGLPFAFAVTAVEKDGDQSIKVRKELGGGRLADVRVEERADPVEHVHAITVAEDRVFDVLVLDVLNRLFRDLERPGHLLALVDVDVDILVAVEEEHGNADFRSAIRR